MAIGDWFKEKEEAKVMTQEEADNLALLEKINVRYHQLDSSTQKRLQRYRLYDQFVEGNQWIRIPIVNDDDSEKITHNLCEPTVRKFSGYLMGNIPRILIPRASELKPNQDLLSLDTPPQESDQEETVPLEFERAEAIEKFLNEAMFVHNDGQTLLKTGAYNGSCYGDTYFYTYWNAKEKRLCWEEIFPGHVRVAYKNNATRMLQYGFIEIVMSVYEIKECFGFDAFGEAPNVDVWDTEEFSNRPSALVKFYWDDDYYCTIINNQIVKKDKNTLGIVPIWHIPNLQVGKNPEGKSDIKDVITIQESYNKALSDEANLAKMYASPKILVRDPGSMDLKALAKKGARVIPIGTKTNVEPLAFAGQIYPLQNRIQRIKSDYHDVSCLPEAAFGNAQGSIVTGVAMTAQFQPTLQIVLDKIGLWDSVLTRMCGFILEMYAKFGGTYTWKDSKGKSHSMTYKEILDGWRLVKLQWGNKVPRDDSIYIQNEALKLKAGLQSRSRTMSNLGIDNPQDELEQIALEQNNPSLTPDLAIQKQLADAQTGSGNEDAVVQMAQEENMQMAQGQAVPPMAKNAKDHKIHIAVHEQFLREHNDLPPEVIDLIDQHILGHEQAMQQGGQGGMRVNAGRPTGEEPMAPAAQDQAMAEAQAAAAPPNPDNTGY